jgi:hypothetical protein
MAAPLGAIVRGVWEPFADLLFYIGPWRSLSPLEATNRVGTDAQVKSQSLLSPASLDPSLTKRLSKHEIIVTRKAKEKRGQLLNRTLATNLSRGRFRLDICHAIHFFGCKVSP